MIRDEEGKGLKRRFRFMTVYQIETRDTEAICLWKIF